MRCPFCKDTEANTKVIDSRESSEGFVIRRRRQCLNGLCERRFTSYERIEELPLRVIKKTEEREPFDAQKIMQSLEIACRKRPVKGERLEAIAKKIEHEIRDTHEREVSSKFIGQLLMRELRSLDRVAYIRYASVYKAFQDLEEYMAELKPLLEAPLEDAKEPSTEA